MQDPTHIKHTREFAGLIFFSSPNSSPFSDELKGTPPATLVCQSWVPSWFRCRSRSALDSFSQGIRSPDVADLWTFGRIEEARPGDSFFQESQPLTQNLQPELLLLWGKTVGELQSPPKKEKTQATTNKYTSMDPRPFWMQRDRERESEREREGDPRQHGRLQQHPAQHPQRHPDSAITGTTTPKKHCQQPQ